MAITNAQQYKQLVNKPANGKRPGYRGPGGYQGGATNQGGAGKAGPVDRGPSDDGGNNVTSGTLSDPREKQDFFTQSYKEPGLFGFGGGYRDLNVASDTSKGFKRGIGSRILGGIFGAINPALGFAFNTLASSPKTFQTFKDSPTLEAFRDNLRGYGRTRPTIFNNPNLDLMIDEEEENNDFSDITNQVTKLNKIETREYNTLQTGKDLGLNSPEQNQRLEELEQKKNQESALTNRAFVANGGIMNPDIVGGEFDFESARQMYGLGKLVKKVTRTVKKIAKSPIGKAAIIGGLGTYGLGALGS